MINVTFEIFLRVFPFKNHLSIIFYLYLLFNFLLFCLWYIQCSYSHIQIFFFKSEPTFIYLYGGSMKHKIFTELKFWSCVTKELVFFFFLLENKRTCSNQPHLVSGFTYFHSNFRSKTLCKLVNTMVITLTLSFVTHISYENTSLSREHLFDLVWLHANIWGKINKQMWPTHCQFKRVYSSTK